MPDFEYELGNWYRFFLKASGAARFRDGPTRVANETGHTPDLVAPPGHRLATRPFVAARDFVGERLLVYSSPREANAVFRDVLIPAGVEPARVVQIQLTEAIVELVAAGLGISVLPRWSVAPQIERGTLVARPLTRSGRFRAWSAAYRSRPAPPPHLLGFVEVLARHPLPVGRTRDERKRIAASLIRPA